MKSETKLLIVCLSFMSLLKLNLYISYEIWSCHYNKVDIAYNFLVYRQHIDTTQVVEKTESCSDTKHVDPTEENVDKACLSVSRAIPIPAESVVHMATDQGNIQPVGDSEWSDIQATETEARIADVREVAPETDGSSLDIPVVSQPVTNHHHEQGSNSFHQP